MIRVRVRSARRRRASESPSCRAAYGRRVQRQPAAHAAASRRAPRDQRALPIPVAAPGHYQCVAVNNPPTGNWIMSSMSGRDRHVKIDGRLTRVGRVGTGTRIEHATMRNGLCASNT